MDGHFSGYASLFGVPDLGDDVVAPGAFAGSLGQRGVSGVRMLFQHDLAEPIGRWLSLREDARGLRVEGLVNLAVQRGREVDALMREGGLDGLSIGFRTVRASPQRGGLRRLLAIDLWEISLVTFPLQTGARIAAQDRPLQTGARIAAPDRMSAPLAIEMRAFARRLAPRGLPAARPVAAPAPRPKRLA